MIWALRIVFWLQFLLGLGLSRGFLGMRPLGLPSGEGDMHMLFGIIAAVLAIVVLRPRGDEADSISTVARFFPLLPLVMGLMIRFGGMTPVSFVAVHALLGIAAVALVEIALARRRRARRVVSGLTS